MDLQHENLVGFLKVRPPKVWGSLSATGGAPWSATPISDQGGLLCDLSPLGGHAAAEGQGEDNPTPSDQARGPCPLPGALVLRPPSHPSAPGGEAGGQRFLLPGGRSTPPHPPGLLCPCHHPSPPVPLSLQKVKRVVRSLSPLGASQGAPGEQSFFSMNKHEARGEVS